MFVSILPHSSVVKGEMIEECGSMLTNMEFLMKHVTITKLKIKVIYIYEFMLIIFARSPEH
jgi:hypothetical protein